jgi:hypothetical protein
LACTGKGRREVAAYLERSGCTADRMFNSLNGDRQMYFIASSGRPVDVMVDRLVMCHTLDFRPSFRNSSLSLDPADLLLSKLQIYGINNNDSLIYMGAMYVLALAIFLVARTVRARQGIDLSLINKEIPVE